MNWSINNNLCSADMIKTNSYIIKNTGKTRCDIGKLRKKILLQIKYKGQRNTKTKNTMQDKLFTKTKKILLEMKYKMYCRN